MSEHYQSNFKHLNEETKVFHLSLETLRLEINKMLLNYTFYLNK